MTASESIANAISDALLQISASGSLTHSSQEIIQADAHVKTAADLATKYRKNVQYNLEATRNAASQPS